MVGSYIYPDAKVVAGRYSPGSCLLAPDRLTDQHYSVMELPGGGALLSVLTYGISEAHHPKCKFAVGRTVAVVDIVESKAREQKMVVVPAGEMASAITATGKVALYGIHFDFNKADIKPESEATLVQMAKLLKDDPALRVLVVGHTDNVGGFGSNMDLSQRRAASVTSVLTGQYGIGKDRLLPVGVAYASPLATNATEEGRAKNRRVELVENAPGR
jgi:outer membrane protein OmpA-like peptidoglycan-associated protein